MYMEICTYIHIYIYVYIYIYVWFQKAQKGLIEMAQALMAQALMAQALMAQAMMAQVFLLAQSLMAQALIARSSVEAIQLMRCTSFWPQLPLGLYYRRGSKT